jgi:alpha-L-fucosidase
MAIEVGEPPEVVGERFTMRFAESKNLLDWKLLPEECVYTKEKYSACPDLHWFEGTFYMIYLEAYPGPSYNPHLVRSKDLIRWEASPHNPILRFSKKTTIGNPNHRKERAHIQGAKNINNSDVEVCEFEGKTILYYSWGNQQGTEFLAHARYEGPVKEFLLGFFPKEN